MPKPNLQNKSKSFGGWTEFYAHESKALGLPAKFSVFVPPQAAHGKVPVLYWLSGLTCTEENFMAKAGAQKYAAEHGLLLVAPDTSPRGAGIPGESESWDFGVGAGFYVNATQSPWNKNYRMYDYVTDELPAILSEHFPADMRLESIFGHSMGGHGALVLALRQAGRYRSVSAFSPIVAPSKCPWGQKALGKYLGLDSEAWAAYDTCRLVEKATRKQELFVEQGTADKFLAEQLKPEELKRVCEQRDYPLKLRMQEGYDHSYYFIASFMEEHVAYHARHLR